LLPLEAAGHDYLLARQAQKDPRGDQILCLVAVLHPPAVTSPVDAVRAAIAVENQKAGQR
jgi:hypothetical protein